MVPEEGRLRDGDAQSRGGQVGETWDPAKDEAAASMRSYGPQHMRGRTGCAFRGRTRHLKIETDAGKQTRMLHFGTAPPLTSVPTRRRDETTWPAIRRHLGIGPAAVDRGGNLHVVTTRSKARLRPKGTARHRAQARS